MRVLAIDPGYDRLGIAVVERGAHGKEKLLMSACITTPRTSTPAERLLTIGDAVEECILRHTPDVCAIETLFLTTNQKTAMLVAGSRGVVLYMAAKHGVPIKEYSPLQVKVAVTGYGKSDKVQVTSMVKKLIAIPEKKVRHDDEFDAIAIGLTCCASEHSI